MLRVMDDAPWCPRRSNPPAPPGASARGAAAPASGESSPVGGTTPPARGAHRSARARARTRPRALACALALVLIALAEACAPAAEEQGADEVVFDAETTLDGPVVLPLLGGRLPRVEAEVAGAGTARFLVDTAMEVTLLDAGFAKRAGLPQRRLDIDFRVTTGGGQQQRLQHVASIERLTLGGGPGEPSATASALHPPLADLAALGDLAQRDEGFDGILGQDVLGDWALLFDAPAGQLVILPADDLLHRLAAHLPTGMACEAIALQGGDRIPRFPLVFSSPAREIEMHVDTGSSRTCLPLEVLEGLGAGAGTPTEAVTLAGSEPRRAWKVEGFPLGTQRVALQVEGTAASWGLLGYDALSQRRFVLDGPGRRLLVAVEAGGQ